MPPSPGVEWYSFTAVYDAMSNTLDILATTKARREALSVLGSIGPRLTPRSRAAPGCTFDPLIVNELDRREAKWRLGREAERKLAVSPEVSGRLADIVAESIERYTRYDPDYFEWYVGDDHEDSSVLPGRKWPTMLDSSPAERTRFIKLCTEYTVSGLTGHRGQYNNIRFNPGGRNRATSYDEVSVIDGRPWRTERWTLRYTMKRMRPIQFNVRLSGAGAGIPNKAGMYAKVYSEACQVLGLPYDKFSFPAVDGGKTYGRVSAALREGASFSTADGVAHESHVPGVLGPAFNAHMQKLGPALALPSGIMLTSCYGTLASLVYVKARVDVAGASLIVVSGDDITVVGGEGIRQVENLLETDDADQGNRFVLGWTFKEDPLKPRFMGAKETIDRAGRGRPYKLNSSNMFESPHVMGRVTDQEVRAWTYGYTGETPDGRSLLDRVINIPAGPVSREVVEGYLLDDLSVQD